MPDVRIFPSPDLWFQCLAVLNLTLPEPELNTWIYPCWVYEEPGKLVLVAPNKYVKQWIDAHCLELLNDFTATVDLQTVVIYETKVH